MSTANATSNPAPTPPAQPRPESKPQGGGNTSRSGDSKQFREKASGGPSQPTKDKPPVVEARSNPAPTAKKRPGASRLRLAPVLWQMTRVTRRQRARTPRANLLSPKTPRLKAVQAACQRRQTNRPPR